MAPRRRRHPQPPVLRRVPSARRRDRHPDLPRGRARRLLGDDGAPPRPRRAHARGRAASSTRPTPGPRGCCSTRSRSRRRGAPVRSAWRILADNTRLPKLVVGDLEAQVAAARLGVDRIARARGRFGLETVRAASEQLMDLSEQVLRREIEALPDGTYEARGRSTASSTIPIRRYRDLPIKVAVTVSGCDLHVDLTGTAPQVDLPINMPFVGTVDIAIYLTLRSILLDSRARRAVATNSGLFRPITIDGAAGHARQPALPGADDRALLPGQHRRRHASCARSPRCCPSAVTAGVGNLKVVAYSGQRDGGAWVYMDIMEGSYGGRPARTASTRSTRSTRTRATTRSRTSSRTTRCASRATSWPRAAAARAAGAAAWARSARSSSSSRAACRSRATATRRARRALRRREGQPGSVTSQPRAPASAPCRR